MFGFIDRFLEKKMKEAVVRIKSFGFGGGNPWLTGVGAEEKITKPYAQHIWVYACVRAIAQNIAAVPFKLYMPSKVRDEWREVESGPLYNLFMRPNLLISRYQLWELTIIFLELEGNCQWILEGTPPREIWIFPPSRFKAVQDPNSGMLIGWKYRYGTKEIPLTLEEVIHFKYANPYHDILGLSPLSVARLSYEMDYAAQIYNKASFENMAEPGGILQTDQSLTEEQFRRLAESWKQRHQGVSKAKEIAILEGGLKWQQISLSPRDMEFIELRKMNREDICAIFKVPPAEVGIYEYANYANAKVQKALFWHNTLIPKINYIQDVLEKSFFSRFGNGIVGEFDLSGVEALREGFQEKVAIAKDLALMGWPINQINKKLDLGFEEVPWGDEWWISLSQVPASSLIGGESYEEYEETPKIQNRAQGSKIKEDPVRDRKWKSFVAKFSPLENQYRKDIREYFYELRRDVLNRLFDNTSLFGEKNKGQKDTDWERILLFELEAADIKLKKISQKYFETAIKIGGKSLIVDIGLDIDFSLASPMAQEFLAEKIIKVTNINRTLREQLRDAISAGLREGESVEEVADRIRHIFNIAANRAKVIARTEISQAVNGGRFIAAKEQGIQEHEWLTARDERVRDSHAAQDGVVVPLGEKFPNGLRYPNDMNGPASEVINCRCTLIPVISRRRI